MDSENNSQVKEFLKEYKYEILLGLIIIGSIVFFTRNNFNSFRTFQNNDHKIDINDILENNYYINLDHRKDRKEETMKELKVGKYMSNNNKKRVLPYLSNSQIKKFGWTRPPTRITKNKFKGLSVFKSIKKLSKGKNTVSKS